ILLHQPPNTSSPSTDLPLHLAGTSVFDVHQWIRAIDQFSKASPQSSSLPSSVLPKSSSSYI
ncbi:MAG: hypothetical protein Q8P67_12415, partial [archaeon]|nr:hypothetical protein [archaeon]